MNLNYGKKNLNSNNISNNILKEQRMNMLENNIEIKDELKKVYDYLVTNERYIDCAEKLKPLINDVKGSSGSEIKNLGDAYSVIDAIINRNANLTMLEIALDLAKISGNIVKESNYVSKIAQINENDKKYLSALEVEKKYCCSKNEYTDTKFVFGHYINWLKQAVILNSKSEICECLSKMYTLVSSSADGIPKIRSSLIDLASRCDRDNEEHREIMKDALESCKLAFPDLFSYDENILENLIEIWSNE